jgi:hypothetical protein
MGIRMLSFNTFLAEANVDNQALGAAYETATAIHLHNLTGSSKNKDSEHQARIAKVKKDHDTAMAKLPPEKSRQAVEYGKKSAEAYLKSLKTNHGINANDVHEVHHTYAGIDKLVGKKVSQAQNPHDIAIKTKSGKIHGASLKFKPGTLSNSPINSFDKTSNSHGIKTNVSDIWAGAKKKAGLEGKTAKEIKTVRDNPEIKQANTAAQTASAKHHTDSFNKSKHTQQKSFLKDITKSSPDVGYDYVVGNKGTSEPIQNKHIHKLIDNAKSFKAIHNGSNSVKVVDHEGKHLMTFEHRPTHGAFRSVQVNGKYGTGK